MSKPWSKYLQAFKNADQIADGIKNKLFKKEHVEAIFTDRWQICVNCSELDLKGENCLAPGTQPCCSDCGCSLEFKLRSLSSECPKGKWSLITSEEEETLINQQIENNGNSN
tara:strand:- start:546 stop:881 length:336 start_codon:yes stop_codon:yes gene_type:complete